MTYRIGQNSAIASTRNPNNVEFAPRLLDPFSEKFGKSLDKFGCSKNNLDAPKKNLDAPMKNLE